MGKYFYFFKILHARQCHANTHVSACPHVAGLAAYLMSIQGANSAAQVDSLMKNLATQTGASVRNNVPGTTNLIANNGNQ